MADERQVLAATDSTGSSFRVGGGYYQILLSDFQTGSDPWKLQASIDETTWVDVDSDLELSADGILEFRGSYKWHYRLAGGDAGAVAHIAPIYRGQPDDR